MSAMIVVKKNIFTFMMSLFNKSTRSAHVRFSPRARKIFRNQKTGDIIIKTISENKKEISEGERVKITNNPDDKVNRELYIQRVAD